MSLTLYSISRQPLSRRIRPQTRALVIPRRDLSNAPVLVEFPGWQMNVRSRDLSRLLPGQYLALQRSGSRTLNLPSLMGRQLTSYDDMQRLGDVGLWIYACTSIIDRQQILRGRGIPTGLDNKFDMDPFTRLMKEVEIARVRGDAGELHGIIGEAMELFHQIGMFLFKEYEIIPQLGILQQEFFQRVLEWAPLISSVSPAICMFSLLGSLDMANGRDIRMFERVISAIGIPEQEELYRVAKEYYFVKNNTLAGELYSILKPLFPGR